MAFLLLSITADGYTLGGEYTTGRDGCQISMVSEKFGRISSDLFVLSWEA
jgi:hypothetical protein